jgi:hypothetical protein
MNTNNSWSNKPAGSQKSGFGAQPGWGGQGSFGQPSVPNPPVYRPTSNFGQPAKPKPPVFGSPSGFGQPNMPKPPAFGAPSSFGQPFVPKPPVYGAPASFGQPAAPKPPVYGAPPSLGAAGPFSQPKPITPLSRPWDPKPAASPAFGFGQPPAKRNAWGDINGDGKEDDWDDFLGDGLLLDAMEAQARAQRGDPPEPEDEFLIGRRRSGPPAARSGASGGAGFLVALGVLCVLGLLMFACALSLMGSAY